LSVSPFLLILLSFLGLMCGIRSRDHAVDWLRKLEFSLVADGFISALLMFVIEAYCLKLAIVGCALIAFLIAVVVWAPLIWGSWAEKIALKRLSKDRPAAIDPKVRIKETMSNGKWRIAGYYACYTGTEKPPEKEKALSTRNFEIILSRCGRVENVSYTGP